MERVNAPAAQAPPILHLSAVVGSPLRDADGERLGKVEDLIVRLGGAGYPPITGVLVDVAGRTSFLGVERVSEIGAGGVVMRKAKLDLRHFERRPEEVLLKRDLLDRQLINVEGARLVRANEIELALVAGSWRVVGVDTGPARRAAPAAAEAASARTSRPASSSTGPASSRSSGTCRRCACACPTRSSPSSIRRRSPTSSRPPRGTRARRSSRPSATTTASSRPTCSRSSTTSTSASSSRTAPTSRSPQILARMAPDDAADVVGELDEDRREPVLALLPVSHRVKVRALLGYDPAEAGGLMSPDFVLLPGSTSAGDALEAVRRSRDRAGAAERRVRQRAATGSLGQRPRDRAAARRARAARWTRCVKHEMPCLAPNASFEEVARLMADYNLTSIPVVDEQRADGRRGHRRRRARGDAPARLAAALRAARRGLNRLALA